VEVPSDAEGYDVGDAYSGVGSGHEAGTPGAQKRPGSWFGWGGGAGSYERVKNE
jgi:receptor expression-enhancing protein 1/2/3/4